MAAVMLLLSIAAVADGPARPTAPARNTPTVTAAGTPEGGIVIDGIAMVVNQAPITLSDLEDAAWYVRFSASLNGSSDLSPLTAADQKQAANHLIDEELLLEAQRKAGYDPVSASAVQQQMDRITRLAGGAAALQRRLQRFHLQPSELRSMVQRQLNILSFLDQRLRPSIVVSSQQIEQYYQKQFIPEARGRGLQPAPLNQVREKIRKIVLEQELEREQQKWLQQLRASARIERTKPALAPLG